MKSIGIVGLLLTVMLTLGGCTSMGTVREQPTFLTYWSGDPSLPDCPSGKRCITTSWTLRDFKNLSSEQEKEGLQLIRFDARRAGPGKVYVGAWAAKKATTDETNVWEVKLDWKEFFRRHQHHTEQGRRLVHLKVYNDDRRPRVAAIWRTGNEMDDPARPDRVVHDLGWEELEKVDKDFQREEEKYYLAEIEVYPRPDDPQIPFVAGIWRPGKVETRLIKTHECVISPDTIHRSSTGLNLDLPCKIDVPIGEEEDDHHTPCPAFDELAHLAAEGFRPADFEYYPLNEQTRLAVLLKRGQLLDWLMVPASADAITCRHQLLENRSSSEDPVVEFQNFKLLDFDLLPPIRHQSPHTGSIDIPPRPPSSNHNGLVHDGGTSGPPDG